LSRWACTNGFQVEQRTLKKLIDYNEVEFAGPVRIDGGVAAAAGQ
jgi:hypothetical protein